MMRLVTYHRNAHLRTEQVTMAQDTEDIISALEEMPPLPLAVQRQLQTLDASLVADLDSCTTWSPIWDEWLRTYVVEMYDVYYEFYSRHPEFKKHWLTAAVYNSSARVFMILRSEYTSQLGILNPYRAKLIKTSFEHASRNSRSPVARALSALSVAQSPAWIDPLSSSPALAAPIETVADQLSALKKESGLTFQQLATGISADITTVQRHCAGKLKPREDKIVMYEKTLSDKLGRSIRIKTP